MARLSRRVVLGGAVGAAGLAAVAAGRGRMASSNDSSAVVRAGLGSTLRQVRERSIYRFDFSRLQDDDMVPIAEPVELQYVGAGAFALPATRFLALAVTATIVIGIDMAPHLEYLGLDPVLDLVLALQQRAHGASWRTGAQTGVTGVEEVRLRAADPAGREEAEWVVADYALETATLEFRLSRKHRKVGPAPEDLFLLNLSWRDRALADQAAAISKALRREDGVSEDLWRPVELDAYTPRVVRLLG